MPTIAVGAISSYDDVNTTLLAGRADLCALGRPHLYDPYWTLHAAAEQGIARREDWIPQYQAGGRRPVDGKLDVQRQPLRSFDPPSPSPTSAAGVRRPPAPALSRSGDWRRCVAAGPARPSCVPGVSWRPGQAVAAARRPGREGLAENVTGSARSSPFRAPPRSMGRNSTMALVFGPSDLGVSRSRQEARGS